MTLGYPQSGIIKAPQTPIDCKSEAIKVASESQIIFGHFKLVCKNKAIYDRLRRGLQSSL